MKHTLLLLFPLAIACSQPEPETTASVEPVAVNEPSQLDKDNWSKHKGYYEEVFTIKNPPLVPDSYELNEDGSCTMIKRAVWRFDGFYKVNNKTGELKMTILIENRIVEEVYSLNDKGQWCTDYAYLQKIK